MDLDKKDKNVNKISLIRFNDDNHAERIFINGEYVGSLCSIGLLIKNIIDATRNLNYDYEFKETLIYVCDDFADYDEDDEIIENIWDFFNSCGQMSEEQINAIENRDWGKLNKII